MLKDVRGCGIGEHLNMPLLPCCSALRELLLHAVLAAMSHAGRLHDVAAGRRSVHSPFRTRLLTANGPAGLVVRSYGTNGTTLMRINLPVLREGVSCATDVCAECACIA